MAATRSQYNIHANSKIWSHSARHASSNCAGETVCTTLSVSTFPLNANTASVFRLGLYFGKLGAGELLGFLTKLATIVWKVFDSWASAGVAPVVLNVPNSKETTNMNNCHEINYGDKVWHTHARNHEMHREKVQEPGGLKDRYQKVKSDRTNRAFVLGKEAPYT